MTLPKPFNPYEERLRQPTPTSGYPGLDRDLIPQRSQEPMLFPGVTYEQLPARIPNDVVPPVVETVVPAKKATATTENLDIIDTDETTAQETSVELEEGDEKAKSSSFSLANLQGMMDKMGGLDGILNTVSKVQKVVSSVQQMAPMIKVLAGSLTSKGDSKDSGDSEEMSDDVPNDDRSAVARTPKRPAPSTPPTKRRRPKPNSPKPRRKNRPLFP